MTPERLWEVAIATPLRRRFIYRIPASLGTPEPGKRVQIPFGHRRVTGFLVQEVTDPPDGSFQIKDATGPLDETSPFDPELFPFLLESASYYLHSLGEVLKTALPPNMSRIRTGKEWKGELKDKSVTSARLADGVTPSEMEHQLLVLQKKAPARYRVLAEIAKAPSQSLSNLRKIHRNATQLVNRLVEDGLVQIAEQPVASDPFGGVTVPRADPPELTPEQKVATTRIEHRLIRGGYEGFLLHGITGSGKTEVYFRVIEKASEQGKGALVLVPEIALTPQLVRRYRARFGDNLAVLHSGLSDGSRERQWQGLRTGRIRVAVGVRSAIFAPLHHLGIVIVDEEHDTSFKQERGFPYNGRDLALLRAARAGAVAVLGSATPSLESTRNADAGKLTRLILNQRATGQALPAISVIDLTRHHSGPGGQHLITGPLFDAICETLGRDEQTILFLNRRGFAPAMVCGDCGESIACPFCSVALTLHARPRGMVCHYCGTHRTVPVRCLSCNAENLTAVGTGTQKAEDTLAHLFPDARVARMDRDSAGGVKGEAILRQLREREIDILVGTQMVTKGHDFPNVTLVGVLNADVGLHMPDFRAGERTFQLLTQVAGRAGRSERGGRAFIQTYSTAHPAITAATDQDYRTFAKAENLSREELGYPPYGRVAVIRINSEDPNRAEQAARELFANLKTLHGQQNGAEISFLGPSPAPLSQIKGRFRWHIMLKSKRQDQIRGLLESALPRIEAPGSGVRVRIDIDPQSML